MRYFLDTEFIEDGKTIDLVSIGIVAEDGREFYACNADCDLTKANDWVKANVLAQLPPRDAMAPRGLLWQSKRSIAELVKVFCDPETFGKPEFWGYFSDYDWVVFAQLFGTMMDLPEGFPMFCMDLKQWAVQLGNPMLPEQTSTEHHALSDARWNRDVYGVLSLASFRAELPDCALTDEELSKPREFALVDNGPDSDVGIEVVE